MQADPAMSVVVFQLASPEGPIERATHGPAQDDDFLAKAWATIAQRDGAQPGDVRRVYSEWEPSDADKAFLDATFPIGADLTFTFRRPQTAEGWPAALAEAQATIQSALDAAPAVGELLPVVRDQDVLSEAIVHRPLTPEIGVFLAHVEHKPEGTIGIHYLTRSQLEGSPRSLEDTFQDALENLIPGLQIEAGSAAEERVFIVRHRHDLAVSALALPDFWENAREWTGAAQVFVAYVEPGKLYVTADADGPFATRMRREVQTSDYYDAMALTPACYTLGPEGLSLVCRRTQIA
jgi:hypothetical protein